MLWKGFQKPKRLAVDTSTLTDKYGIFWAQPFERGFGTTVGNALRRVLLSSIEGAAVTAVKCVFSSATPGSYRSRNDRLTATWIVPSAVLPRVAARSAIVSE